MQASCARDVRAHPGGTPQTFADTHTHTKTVAGTNTHKKQLPAPNAHSARELLPRGVFARVPWCAHYDYA